MAQITCTGRNTECTCPPSQCRAATPDPIKAPVLAPEPRDYLALFAFAAVMSIIAFGALYQINQQGVELQIEARI